MAPVQPVPPHCPYFVCVAPAAEEVCDGGAELLPGAVAVEVATGVDAEPGAEEAGEEAVADPTGAVGTVEGWLAVFQVAVVGQGVAATAGEVVP